MALGGENNVIHGLWVGNQLSTLELLTLHSFTAHGHTFHLWVYEPLANELPGNVVLRNANEIIPEAEIFRRNHDDPIYKIGKGSIGAPFSDLFRYKLLYEHGGWWVDMDVTCLRPFEISEPYFFRAHPILPMIGNIIKVPAKSELMKRAYEETKARCDADTLEWLLPNKILNRHIEELQLSAYINGGLSVSDWWEDVEVYLRISREFPASWFFIHWMNEEWRSKKLDKGKMYAGTSIGDLCQQYGLAVKPYPALLKLRMKLKYLFKPGKY